MNEDGVIITFCVLACLFLGGVIGNAIGFDTGIDEGIDRAQAFNECIKEGNTETVCRAISKVDE